VLARRTARGQADCVRLRFSGCVFDSDTREVRRGASPVELSPKAFELLELLIESRPRVLPKQEIHERLWPGVFVSDASLSNVVAELRAALRDDAHQPNIVRTVHRFGYGFVAEPEPESRPEVRLMPPVLHKLLWEAREIELSPGETFFGRDRSVVWIDDPSVSRRHARISVDGELATIRDLGSKNGTLVNGDAVAGDRPLADGDEIRIGRARMTFHVLTRTGSTQTASSLHGGGRAKARKRAR
jgi:DNA-binding winged helix-turn-helix (wHTH) protein